MPKYIDADALLAQMKDRRFYVGRRSDPVCLVEDAPAADVEPVVRCKDCKHRDPEDLRCDCGGLERAGCIFSVFDNYFCAYGERKEADNV